MKKNLEDLEDLQDLSDLENLEDLENQQNLQDLEMCDENSIMYRLFYMALRGETKIHYFKSSALDLLRQSTSLFAKRLRGKNFCN